MRQDSASATLALMIPAERDALLTLLLTPGLGPTLVGRCTAAFGSAQATFNASADELAAIQGISRQGAARLRQRISESLEQRIAQRELQAAADAGARLIAIGEADYPQLLGHIPDPPPILWVRGELREEDALALAVVGSRRCSHYGREQADRFAYQCAQAGLCIVSGGAYGIDAAAHHAALRAGGRTIAVLGSGLGNPYPKQHAGLFDQIAAAGGAVVSELPMRTAPAAENFPRRNRIISGLSLGTLVIEAAIRSGALITARLCVEEHGRELLAVPGPVDSAGSAGCHKVIREGWATLVTNAADVLDALGETGQLLKAGKAAAPTPVANVAAGAGGAATAQPGSLFEANLSDAQQKIMGSLAEPRTLDQIAAWTTLPIHQVQAELTMLEIRGTIKRQGGLFTRRGQ